MAIYTKAVAEFEDFGRFREHVTFEDLLVNLVRVAPEHAVVTFKQFRDIGVTLPLPTTTSRDEEELPGDSLPGRPIPAAPWWFGASRDEPEAVAVGTELVAEQPVAPATAPCAGCLDEQAVLDVAGVFLASAMPEHLGIRVERYLVSVPDDVDPGDAASVRRFFRDLRRSPRPALPAGLVDAPPGPTRSE